MSFSNLKKRQKNLGDLTKKLKTAGGKKDYSDDRFWQPTYDSSKNAGAVIRFLPENPDKWDSPFVTIYRHAFKNKKTNRWFIAECPTSLGSHKKCPVCEANNDLWSTGVEADKDIARERKRQKQFISNIYVVKDPQKPENEGKVFLYRYGKTIFEKITAAAEPKFVGDEAFDPFDLWEGANFKLRIRTEGNYPKYDQSTFENPGALSNNEKELEYIYNQMHDLSEFTKEDYFENYEQLSEKLKRHLGAAAMTKRAEDVEVDDDDIEEIREIVSPNGSAKPRRVPKSSVENEPSPSIDSEDALNIDSDYLNGLLEDDDVR